MYERTAGFLETSSLAAALPPHPSASQPLSQDINGSGDNSRERPKHVALKLLYLAQKCRVRLSFSRQRCLPFADSHPQNQGMSGRSLRRLPVLAHARYMGTLPMPARATSQTNGATKVKKHGLASENRGTGGSVVEVWLDAMERVIDSQACERERFGR